MTRDHDVTGNPTLDPARPGHGIRVSDLESAAGVTVDRPIRISWQRSLAADVPVDLAEPSWTDVASRSTALIRAAEPIVAQLEADLHDEPISVIVTDAKGVVLLRTGGDRSLLSALDDVYLAPGFSYSETEVGTNGIGTAIEVGGAILIDGAEHYTDTLRGFSCAGALVRNPMTGVVVGVVDITTQAGKANPLMMSFAKMAAERIQERLMHDSSALDKALLDDYQIACRHSGGAVIALGGELLMMNSYLQRHFSSGDRAAILDHTEDARGSMLEFTTLTELPSGLTARMTYNPTFLQDSLAGVIVNVREHRAKPTAVVPGRTRSLPGVAGDSSMWLHATEEILKAFRRGEWLIVEGEAAVGKHLLLRAAHRHLHPARRLAVVDAADGSEPGVDVAERCREAIDAGDDLLVTHAHQLSVEALDDLAELLQQLRDEDAADGPWVGLTVVSGSQSTETSGRVIGYFPRTVVVPPLRHHIEDLPALCRLLLDGLGATDLTLSTQALGQLSKLSWTGNVAHLQGVLTAVHRHRRSGEAGVADLPPECRSTIRRQLTPMEAMERDAIVHALALQGDNKAAAAGSLGMSRATIYRKIRSYGIQA